MTRRTTPRSRELATASVAAAEAVLADEVAGLVTGEDWRQFLDDQARFYDLDAHNVLLVVSQHLSAYGQGRVPDPSPTYVASFDTWKALGRHVERGQHGYTLLVPGRASDPDARAVPGRSHAAPRGQPSVAAEREAHAPARHAWRPATVFALSQTAGREVEVAVRATLGPGESPPGLKEAMVALIEARGWTVTTAVDVTTFDGAHSRPSYRNRCIMVRGDLDDAAMVRALLQGAAHVVLHGDPPGRYLPQAMKELEAQSVAYVVAAAHAMSSDGASFPDVADWAGEQAAKAIRTNGARISRAARAIIAVSPADHVAGSTPPGADLALAALRRIDQEAAARKAELLDRISGHEMPAPDVPPGPTLR